ncbi:LysR family transcriptional regulator [Nocardia sp. NPDC050630]|uniref:LysR family transcriptional regulator n=1 Tax=Nocardia sp. NPDC050630 TaxID=3364321 RepID=UPI0037A14F90
MELRQLRYFLAVAEERNLTRAAETLGIRPTSLSQQIIALERHLDARLFVRTSAGMTPTPAGERLFDRARVVVAEARRAEESVRSGRLLRLAVTPGISPDVVAMLWRLARPHTPDIADMQTAEQVRGLRGGVLDVGLLLLPVDSPDLKCVTVADAELGVVAAVGHRLAGQDSVRWPDLEDSALLWFARASAPGYYDAVRDVWTRAGWRPAAVREGAPRRALFEAELRHGGDVIGLRPAWDVPGGAGRGWFGCRSRRVHRESGTRWPGTPVILRPHNSGNGPLTWRVRLSRRRVRRCLVDSGPPRPLCWMPDGPRRDEAPPHRTGDAHGTYRMGLRIYRAR